MDPNNNYIYIKFATIKSNALLLYNYDNQTGERAEFLALEIVEGRLRFSYNLGGGTYKLTTAKKVSDGQFHTAIARRAGMVRNAKMRISRRVQPNPFGFQANSEEREISDVAFASRNSNFGKKPPSFLPYSN